MADLDLAKKMIADGLRADEGERLKPYLCSAGVPTIGVGATTYLDGRKVKLSDPPITREQMDRMLEVDVDRYVHAVLEMVDGECGTHQLVGLVRCGYNIGLPALQGSSMIRLHKLQQFAAAARSFQLWNKARRGPKGPLVEVEGLTARRLREAAIYATPDDPADQAKPPQAVAAEPSLAASPTMQTGTAAAATGVIAIVSQAGDQVGQVGTVLQQTKAVATETLGIPADWFLPGVLVAVGGLVLYRRWQQRQDGRA